MVNSAAIEFNSSLKRRDRSRQNSLNTAEIAANPKISATNMRQRCAGTLPKDFAPNQLPASMGRNRTSDSQKSRQLANPSAKADSVPAIAVAKKTSIIDARASAGGMGWRR